MRAQWVAWAGRPLALLAAASALSGLLTACATPQAPATAQSANALALVGRLSLVSGPADAQKALYGGFRLVLQGQTGRFDVFSPLGQMLARAQWSPGQATLDDGRQSQLYPSFQDMTRAALGVALPQAALQDWVRGHPAADLPAQGRQDGGFEQLGWAVQPTWRDGRLTLLSARRLAGEPAELRMVIESASPAAGGEAPREPQADAPSPASSAPPP